MNAGYILPDGYKLAASGSHSNFLQVFCTNNYTIYGRVGPGESWQNIYYMDTGSTKFNDPHTFASIAENLMLLILKKLL